VGVARLADALEEPEGVQAVRRLLRQAPRQAALGGHVGGGEGGGQPGRQQPQQLLGLTVEAPLVGGHQRAPGHHPAAPAPRLAGLVAAVLLLADQRQLELQVRMSEQLGAVDQLGEQVLRPAGARRAPALDAPVGVVLDQPARLRHRQHQAHAVLGQQRRELGAHGAEVARLHLDQQVARDRVDHVAAERDLEAAAGRRRQALQGGVQRGLVEGADRAHRARIPA